MVQPKLSRLELQIMEALWTQGASSVREILQAFPDDDDRPAYTTVQTMVYRLEAKKAVRRVKKISNAHIFEAAVSRSMAERRLVDDLLSAFSGRMQPLMSHLVESGKLTLRDLEQAENALRALAKGSHRADRGTTLRADAARGQGHSSELPANKKEKAR